MSNRKRVAETNVGAFLSPGDLPIPVPPMNALDDGPGEPGPGDEWTFPTGPVQAETDADATTEPGNSDGTIVSPLHPTDRA